MVFTSYSMVSLTTTLSWPRYTSVEENVAFFGLNEMHTSAKSPKKGWWIERNKAEGKFSLQFYGFSLSPRWWLSHLKLFLKFLK